MARTIADMLVAALAEAGVKRIYGIVGDSLNPLTDAIRRDGRIQWIHVRHEEAGAFAAGAEAQLTGDLVVCAGSCGPGHVHLLNGLYDCHRSGAPVLAIASHIPSGEIGTTYFQETHPEQLFAECSHFCEMVLTPTQAPRLVQIAMQRALTQGGVSVLVLPGDIAGLDAVDDATPQVARSRPTVQPAADEVAELAALINRSERVTIFGGIGSAGAREEVLALAERIKAPIAFAFRGKQALEYDNPYSIGMTGLLGWGSAYETMHASDLLLLLGTDFPYSQFYPTDCHIAQVDIRPEHLGRRARLDLGICGDVGATLRALLPQLDAKTETSHLDGSLRAYNAAIGKLQAYVTGGAERSPIRPEFVASTLNELAADDAVFTVDTGTPNIWAARYIQASRGRRIIGSFNHGSMANAMPQAIGAQLAYPGRQVIALAGDGGFAMLLGDLLTVMQYQLPLKIVVFNNGRLDFVELEMEQAGLVPFGTELWNPNFGRLAEAIGARGVRIEEPGRLRDDLAAALAAPGPAVIDVVVDGSALSLPPHIELGQAEGFALSIAKQVLEGRGASVVETIAHNLKLRP